MPDNTDIERTIYKLEIDGSAYIEGADKLSASTNKLTEAQEASNRKLIELKAQQASYKKQLDDINTVLKENEKETIALSKDLNALKESGKGATAEAKNLQSQLRGLTVNTKEFKVEAAALKTNLTNTTTAIKAQTVELKAAEAASGNFTKGLTKAYSGLRTLANIIPGIGIGGLVALIAGPLVNAVTSWYEGLDKANNALELLKANQQNLNDVMEAADKSAGKQIIDAKILYETATNVNLSMKDRLDAVRALQKEFPDYFKNISAETILNGQAEQQYNDLTTAILATAKATAAKAKLDELEAQRLDIAFQKQKIINATNKEAAAAKTFTTGGGGTGGSAETGFGTGGTETTITKEEQVRAIQARRDAALAIQNQNDKLLAQQEDFLIKFAGLTNIARGIEATDEKKFHDKKEAALHKQLHDDFEKRKADLIAQISALAAIGADEEEAIRQKFKDQLAKELLDINQDQTTTEKEKAQLILLATQLNYAQLEKALIDFNNKKAKIISDAFIKEFDEQDAQDKKLLQQQLDAGAASIKAMEEAERKKYEAMKTPVPFQGATKDPVKGKGKELADYAAAVEKVANSVVQFWQATNDAEARALDYSISLQEKRVDAAQKIADRGNAEYLKQEQDRLDQLNVARENAARKQLGIDAALQASQILVGITGAISKIATSPFGAETIAEIAVIIGALATGYGIVKNLQGNQPKLYKGTKYLERDGNPSGRDTIPVMANEGEAVIPTETNRKYHPAISAIYDHAIPAEDLNNFVNTYHKLKPIPQPNYERIKEAAELKIGHDGRMSVLLMEHGRKMDEHIELQKLTLSAMKKLGVNVSLDQHGFAVTQMEVIDQLKKSRYK